MPQKKIGDDADLATNSSRVRFGTPVFALDWSPSVLTSRSFSCHAPNPHVMSRFRIATGDACTSEQRSRVCIPRPVRRVVLTT